jgi:hypothetical protein
MLIVDMPNMTGPAPSRAHLLSPARRPQSLAGRLFRFTLGLALATLLWPSVFVGGAFDALQHPLEVVPDQGFDNIGAQCSENQVFRAVATREVLPASLSSWTIALDVAMGAPTQLNGVLLQLGEIVILRIGKEVVLQRSHKVEVFRSVVTWSSSRVRIAVTRSNGIFRMCINDVLLPVPLDSWSGISLARVVLGDLLSQNSLGASYEHLYVHEFALPFCADADSVKAPPAASTPAVDIIALSGPPNAASYQVLQTLAFTAVAKHKTDVSAVIKISVTAFGVSPEDCNVAECGDTYTVRPL